MEEIKCAVIGLRGFPGVQGGVEKHCEALYPRMKGFRFYVFRRSPYLPDDASDSWKGINFIDLPSTRIKGFEALFHTFIAALRAITLRPRIVHIHNIGPGLFAPLLKLAGIKVITTYHSANYEHKKWGPLGRAVLRLGEKMALGYSDRIIFVNKAKYDSQPEKIKRRSALIPNGVTAPSVTQKTDFLEKTGIRPGEYLLAVGRLTPEKGFEYLVEAVQKIPEIKNLVIAGGSDHDSSYAAHLKRLDSTGKVIFTGNLQGEPLQQLYSNARGFVLSSVTEGFPLVLLEAMSYQLPVLVSRIDATEALDFLPEEAFFTPASSAQLSKSLQKFIENTPPGKRISYPLERYDWKSIAELTSSLFRSIIKS